jgi:hypothetical protein
MQTNILNELNCPICMETLIKPITYECGHNVCDICHKYLILSGRTLKCSECRYYISKKNINENKTLSKIIKLLLGDKYDENLKEKEEMYKRQYCIEKFEETKYYKKIYTSLLQYINHYKCKNYNNLYEEIDIKITIYEYDYILYDLYINKKIVLCKNDIISIDYINQYILNNTYDLSKDELIILLINSNCDYKILYDKLNDIVEYDETSLISILTNYRINIYDDIEYNTNLFKQLELKINEEQNNTIIDIPRQTYHYNRFLSN